MCRCGIRIGPWEESGIWDDPRDPRANFAHQAGLCAVKADFAQSAARAPRSGNFDLVVCQNSVPRLDDGRAAWPWRAMSLVLALLGALRAALRTRTELTLENLALRQQLALLRRQSKRPQFGRLDRLLWMWLSNQWAGWREALHVVRPETVIRWHRQGFRTFWTWKSRRGRTGRPPVASELADLVRTMARANPRWGAPRIHGELLKLGLDVSQRTVARLMLRRPKPPSSDLANVPSEPPRRPRLRRLLRRTDRDLPGALRVRAPAASSPSGHPLQRDRFPHRRLDRPANRRGVSR